MLLLLPSARTVVAIVSNRGSLVYRDDTWHPSAKQQADLNLVVTAQKLANVFAPLYVKP